MTMSRDGITKGALKPFLSMGCSGAVLQLVNRAADSPMADEERAAAYLAGGILTHGYQCGQVWGAVLAAGAAVYRRLGSGPAAESAAIDLAGRLVDVFREQNGAVDCFDLTDTDWQDTRQMIRYMLRGQSVRCYRMTKAYTRVAFTQIATDTAPVEAGDVPAQRTAEPTADPTEPFSDRPVSCAAAMARRLGMSEVHTMMAAGLAGGIGLSGGGCGALGTAVWHMGLRRGTEGDGKIDFKDPGVAEVIEAFLAGSGYEFECAEIVGRRFGDTAEHTEHVRDGGCAELMDALAAACVAA